MAKNSESKQGAVKVRELIAHKKSRRHFSNFTEKIIPAVLLLLALVSVFTTVGIIVVLVSEAYMFFTRYPIWDFLTGTVLKPMSAEPEYGILPLVNGTIISTVIAILVGGPIGLMVAIYLSEFATDKVRQVLKPLIEILAGIPTIVYGFFAFTLVTPFIRMFFPDVAATNILSPGIVMGFMIIPMIASLSEDAMRAVPYSMREAAFALGATKLEVTQRIVMPAAISGITASFVLGISRAIGETMILSMAGGSSKNFSFDVTQSMQTMTAYIVEIAGGDAAAGSTIYYSLYAVALTLFVFTLLMNVIAKYISRKFREEY